MRRTCAILPLCCWLLAAWVVFLASDAQSAPESKPQTKTPKEALQPFNDLIGSWKATGTPEGTKAEKDRGFWTELIHWKWKFKGEDVYLLANFDDGKHFRDGELRYLPDKDVYQFKAIRADRETVVFEGKFKDQVLTLNRTDPDTGEAQRLTIKLLHNNIYRYQYEVKPAERPTYRKLYEVGAVKKGVPFAGPASSQPECIVSGGLGTMRVSYKGVDYYVCCTGCRNAFLDDPEKFIKEYNDKKAKKP